MSSNDNDFSITISNISKAYPIFKNPQDRLKQMIWRSKKTFYETFWALKGINLNIKRGETLGILGRNGSGKSTLLQIIAGTLKPTTGEVKTNGRIAALLELGAGFNPEFTGAENVALSGTILGISEDEMKKRYQKILDFADIGTFIDQPVKKYSSGMYARLAFAVASSVSPDILIVDEILAVGDAKFQAKCFARLKELKDLGTTIILVTHSPEQVVQHCQRAILLNNGELLSEGESKTVVNQYLELLFGKDIKQEDVKDKVKDIKEEKNNFAIENANNKDEINIFKKIEGGFGEDLFSTRLGYNKYEYRWGGGEATILDYIIISDKVKYPTSYKSNSNFELIAKCVFHKDVLHPIFGFTLKAKNGETLYGTNSQMQELDTSSVKKEIPFLISVKGNLNLHPGDYFISLGLVSMDSGEVVPYDRRYDSIHINVIDSVDYYGIFDMELNIKLT